MTPRAGGRLLTVGAVVRTLAEEFPDISVSKVRFLETEGLVTPARTASGYRQFTERDVERLRYVLRAQRDHYWPLRVIRERLEMVDRGLDPGQEGALHRPQAVADRAVPDPTELLAGTTLRLTAAELAEASGLEPSALAGLRAHGLLRPDRDDHYDEADLGVARAAAGLAAFGIEARHLRPFRTAADREVGLVEQAVGARRGTAADRDRAQVAQLCLALHTALVRGGLSDPSR